MIAAFALAACGDTPAEPLLNATDANALHRADHARGQARGQQAKADRRFTKTVDTNLKDGVVRLSSAPVLRGCPQSCELIVIGDTKLVGWRAAGGAAAVTGLKGAGSLSFVVGGSDTIPAPPAPMKRQALRGEAAVQYAELLNLAGIVGPSDTIPSPPNPFVFTVGDDAVFFLWVDDLVAKKVIPSAPSDGFEFALTWTDGNRRIGTTFMAQGWFPPSDTIPGPPAPTD